MSGARRPRKEAGRRLAAAGALVGASALALPASASAADLVPIEWNAAGAFERSLTLAPAKFVEVCGRLAAGARIEWRFEASQPSDFNIHYPEGQAVRYPAKEEARMKSAGTLEAAREQDYCWMWSNRSARSLGLRVQLQRLK